MNFAIQAALNGLSTGAIYGLIAAGFSLTYQATSRFNFGLGMWVMLGAMLSYSLVASCGIIPPIALIMVCCITFALGWLAELVTIRPFKDSRNDLWIVATLVVGLLLIDVAQLIWGKYPLSLPDYLGSAAIEVLGISIRTQHILNFGAAIAIFLCIHIFFNNTHEGASYRAVAADKMTAELMGINTRRVEQISFGTAAALAGFAGFMIAPVMGAEANVGTALGFKGFAVAIVGGLAAPRGVLIIGLFVGVFESLISAYLFTGIRDILAFSIMIAALYLLPFGVFGHPERELR